MKHTYFLADTTHEEYATLVANQKEQFDCCSWATNHVMITNLAWTQSINKIFWELPVNWAILNSDFDPSTRDMLEWEIPL